MKKILTLFSIFIALLVFAGCGGEGNKNKAAAERSPKGEVVISVGKYMISGGYDPTVGWGMWGPDPFHSGLHKYNKENKLEKDLATDVKVSSDGKEYIVSLRKDVKFADGKALTAKDVAFTYKTAKEAKSSVDLTFLDSAEALDEYTVKFILNKPYSPFLETTATLGIVPSHVYNKDGYGAAPMGSGPWKVISFQKEQQLIMVPNEHYYGVKPKLKKVTVLNISDDAVVAAAKSGQLDLVFLNPEYADAKVENMRVTVMESIDAFTLNLPMEKEREENGVLVGNNVTSDLAIRQALNIGINREEIIKNALNGFGEPTMNYSKHISWVNTELTEKDNRVEEAKSILEKAGWKDTDGDGIREKEGIKAEFTISGRSNDLQRYNTAVALAKDAKKLGINIIAKSMAWSDARKIARNVPTIWAFGDFSPQSFYSYFHSSQIGKNVINNPAMYNNPVVDEHITAAFSATDWNVAIKELKLAQWDGKTGPKVDIPYLWITAVKVPYLVNEKLDLGNIGINERGQGMGILSSIDEWSWK